MVINSTAKRVTEYLNEVLYGTDELYVPSDFALEIVNLIKLIHGGELENKTPLIHFKMLDNYVVDKRNVINLCFRGAAKTTLTRYLIYYIALYGEMPNLGKVPYMLYISDSMEGGIKKMRKGLEYLHDQSPFLQQYLNIKFTDSRWEFIRKTDKTSLIVTGYGGKTNIRGTVENNSRPVLALLDDIISDEDARSPTEIENIKTNIYSSLLPALHPKRRKIIWNGTPFNANDPIYSAVESGAWTVNVYPVCEKFPCTKEEFKGAWEDRFDYESVNQSYQILASDGKASSFYQELMLQILSTDTKLIQTEDIKWYSLRTLKEHKANFNFYITTDFATSEKQHSDFSFISVWAINNQGFRYWVDGVCKRQDMNGNMDDLFRLVQMYNPQSVGIEVSGQQGGFIPWIEQEMMRRNIFFHLASDNNSGKAGIKPTVNKLQRFNVVVPYFKKGEMYFPVELKHTEALKELLLELDQATIGGFKSKHDDGLDTISMLALMPIWLPSAATQIGEKSSIWDDDIDTSNGYAIDSYLV